MYHSELVNGLLAHHVSKRRSLATALSTKKRLVEIRSIDRDAAIDAPRSRQAKLTSFFLLVNHRREQCQVQEPPSVQRQARQGNSINQRTLLCAKLQEGLGICDLYCCLGWCNLQWQVNSLCLADS